MSRASRHVRGSCWQDCLRFAQAFDGFRFQGSCGLRARQVPYGDIAWHCFEEGAHDGLVADFQVHFTDFLVSSNSIVSSLDLPPPCLVGLVLRPQSLHRPPSVTLGTLEIVGVRARPEL